VGPSSTPFRVHEKILCDKVPDFSKLFHVSFVEAHEKKAILFEDDPEVFRLFVEWLHTGQYAKLDVSRVTPTFSPFTIQLKLYAFVEILCLQPLMGLTMTVLISNYRKHNKSPDTEDMALAYRITLSGSLLRCFMARGLYTPVLWNSPRESGPQADFAN
jgi:hypothetical protein